MIIFKTFVSNIFLSSIRIPNIYCMAKLNIAYNNAYRTSMNYRRRNSASLTIMLIIYQLNYVLLFVIQTNTGIV